MSISIENPRVNQYLYLVSRTVIPGFVLVSIAENRWQLVQLALKPFKFLGSFESAIVLLLISFAAGALLCGWSLFVNVGRRERASTKTPFGVLQPGIILDLVEHLLRSRNGTERIGHF